MKIQKRILSLKQARQSTIKELENLVTKAADDDALKGDDAVSFEDLKSRIASLSKEIDDLAGIQKDIEEDEDASLPSAADNINEKSFRYNGNAPAYHDNDTRKKAFGEDMSQYMIGHYLKKEVGENEAVRVVRDIFNNKAVAKAISTKNITTPLGTTSQSIGGALIPQDFSHEVIELSYANSPVRKFNPKVVPMPFGNFTIPRVSTGANVFWGLENTSMTAGNPSFDNKQMFAKRLTAYTYTSKEELMRSPLAVESIIRSDMIMQVNLAEDIGFIMGDGSSQNPIVGLVNLGTAITPVTATPTLTVVLNTLNAMIQELQGNNVLMTNPGWIFPSSILAFLRTLTDQVGHYFFLNELQTGKLLGIPFQISNQIPANGTDSTGTISGYSATITLTDFDQVIIGDTLNTFTDAADMGSAGGSGDLFMNWQVAFRVIKQMDMTLMHPFASTSAKVWNWMPTGYTPVAAAPYATQPADTTPSHAASANTSTTSGA